MDKFRVNIAPDSDGVLPDDKELDGLYAKMIEAGWTDDPLEGKAVLLADGREVLNPLPVAPPVGYVRELSIMDRLSDMLEKRMAALLESQALEETAEEANDFDTDDEEAEIRSIYEVQLQEEFPAIPGGVVPDQPASPDPVPAQPGPDGPAAGPV